MNQNILLCGLPSSGKTTFLAALWYLLYNNNEIATALSLRAFPQKREYLNELSELWSSFIQFTRTSDELQEISLQLNDGPREIDFHIPDMSGETWEAIWSTRFCAEDAAKWAQAASGVMLSIHADKYTPAVDIMTCQAMRETAGINKSETSFEFNSEAAVNKTSPSEETPSEAEPGFLRGRQTQS
jgi:GTPase SAR1 family protein